MAWITEDLADRSYIERCADAAAPSGLPLVGNGDVFSWKDYQRHMSSGRLATCMIGRGALIKPWVLTEIKEKRVWDITASERLGIFRDFANHGLEHWGADEKARIVRTHSFRSFSRIKHALNPW